MADYSVDFSPIANLPNVYRQARQQAVRERTLADLASGRIDTDMAAQHLVAGGDPMGIALSNLAFQRQEAKRDQANKDRDFGKPQIIGSAETGYYAINRGPNGVSAVGAPGAAVTPGAAMPGTSSPVGGMQPLIPAKPSTLTREQEKEYAARIKRYNEQADEARGLQTDIAEVRGLRGGVTYEGGMLPDFRTNVGRMIGMQTGRFGIPSAQEAGTAEALRSKAVDLQLGFSEKTKGAITDREMSLFGGATPGLNMSDEGANKVLDAKEVVASRVIERSKFYQTYVQRHGSLAGADQAWDSFRAAKPILSRDKAGQLVINKDNVGGWEKFVGEGNATPRQQQPATQVPKGAVDLLRSNPALRADFDAKYGAGASMRVLGQ